MTVVSYNLRYLEKHGRDTRDPWSWRQSVFHHDYDLDCATSSWIIIQPPERWNASLDDMDLDKQTHPLSLHLRSLSSASANTWEYLQYLSGETLLLDQRVTFPKPTREYKFDCTLNQDIHVLRKNLFRAKGIIEGMLRIVAALCVHAKEIQDLCDSPKLTHDKFMREMANISRDLLSYQSMTEILVNRSADIRSTTNSILKFRSQEMVTDSGEQLRRIGEVNSRETSSMTSLAKWSYRDSRTTRIATTIGLVYLPANLVLSFFSTSFVEFASQEGSSGERTGPRFLRCSY
ncbi:hypothetical protein B0T24DRAFT_662915 [Lasiosphaeria ovina]|uniref:CorA-like transporter domain-containing protein n=1 Tax=Lasiosphaeria ovina TaxID=92902 RepID=A0AAE0TZ10_9PEZI|nr:hypothetical protein B0T24DRAFT_662915 [Lasiosphaeria ovina]